MGLPTLVPASLSRHLVVGDAQSSTTQGHWLGSLCGAGGGWHNAPCQQWLFSDDWQPVSELESAQKRDHEQITQLHLVELIMQHLKVT